MATMQTFTIRELRERFGDLSQEAEEGRLSRPVVVSDSGPLIALARSDQLEPLLAVFEAVHMPKVVLDETTTDRSRPGAVDIEAFVQTYAQAHPNRHDVSYVTAVAHLDEGEAQAPNLAYVRGRSGVSGQERVNASPAATP
ncbi:MAG: hypothetical protein QM766_21705 [Burkholderiaceae bacterium]